MSFKTRSTHIKKLHKAVEHLKEIQYDATGREAKIWSALENIQFVLNDLKMQEGQEVWEALNSLEDGDLKKLNDSFSGRRNPEAEQEKADEIRDSLRDDGINA